MKNSALRANAFAQYLLPVATVLMLLALVVWLAGGFDEKIAPGLIAKPRMSSTEGIAVQSVETAIVEPIAGSVVAKQSSIISSRLLARIEKINVRAGDIVTQGQVLIQLEKSDLQSRVSQAQERVNAVMARYVEAQLNLQRTRDLFDKKLVAAFALDKANADFNTLAAELLAAKEGLTSAQVTLAFSEIQAPMNGRVVDRFAQPGDTAQPGARLLSIYNPLSLQIAAAVREQLAVALVIGEKIQVEIPALGRLVDAEIVEIVPAADIGSRSFTVKARIEFNDKLLPGMYARLLVPAGMQTQLLIPTDKVAKVGQLTLVWVNENGDRQRRFVRLGKQFEPDQVAVVSGVNEGELILNVPGGL